MSVLQEFAAVCAGQLEAPTTPVRLPPKKRKIDVTPTTPERILCKCVRRMIAEDPENLPTLCRVAFDDQKTVDARVELMHTLWLRHVAMRAGAQG